MKDILRSERRKVETIDRKMRKLFLKRMYISSKIGKIKDELGLPHEDKDREAYLKKKYSKDLIDYRDDYLVFLEQIFNLSKKGMEK